MRCAFTLAPISPSHTHVLDIHKKNIFFQPSQSLIRSVHIFPVMLNVRLRMCLCVCFISTHFTHFLRISFFYLRQSVLNMQRRVPSKRSAVSIQISTVDNDDDDDGGCATVCVYEQAETTRDCKPKTPTSNHPMITHLYMYLCIYTE